MPDLHGWISQKIDAVEECARACPPWPWTFDTDDDAVIAADGIQVADVFALSSKQLRATGLHVIANDPEAVLRRCAADRKILEIHSYGGGSFEPYSCNGCGSDSEWGPIVEHTNDCETLQALAAGYGLTDEERLQLDRPQPPDRPTVTGKPLYEALADAFDEFAARHLGDTAAERYVGDLTVHQFAGLMPVVRELLPPTPVERALDILRPHLRNEPLYRDRP